MEINQIIVMLGLLGNVFVLAVVVKKFVILENIFMIHWKGVAVSLHFVMLGFFAWFLAEALEESFYTLYLQLLPVCFALLTAGQILLAYSLLRRKV